MSPRKKSAGVCIEISCCLNHMFFANLLNERSEKITVIGCSYWRCDTQNIGWHSCDLFSGLLDDGGLVWSCQVRLFKRGNIEKVKKWGKETNVHDNQRLFVALRANWLVCRGCENKQDLHESLCSLSVSQISVSGSVHEITAVQQYSCLQGYLWSCCW